MYHSLRSATLIPSEWPSLIINDKIVFFPSKVWILFRLNLFWLQLSFVRMFHIKGDLNQGFSSRGELIKDFSSSGKLIKDFSSGGKLIKDFSSSWKL